MVQQKLAQLLLLHLTACSLKAFLHTANEKKWEAVHKFPTKVEMNLETEFMTTGFVTLKVVTKMKNK